MELMLLLVVHFFHIEAGVLCALRTDARLGVFIIMAVGTY